MKHELTDERCPNGIADDGYEHDGTTCRRCSVCQRFAPVASETANCPGPEVAAAAEPDTDEVRRALDEYAYHRHAAPLLAAAAAWLKLREQPVCGRGFDSPTTGTWMCELPRDHKGPHSAPSVNRIEGCKDCAKTAAKQQPAEPAPTISQVIEACEFPGEQRGFTVHPWAGGRGSWRAISGPIETFADTPEAAIRALYDDAVARWEQQRDEAAAKLQKLGRS